MNLWAVLGNVAAALLILVIVLAIIVAVVTAVAVVIGIAMAIKDDRRKKQINELPDKMMEQAAAGLKERDERNESM